MHAPKKLGGYPLTLRDHRVANPRKGELLLNYATDDLMYVDRISGDLKRIADQIYNQIISAKIENTVIDICKQNEKVPGDESIIPVENRKMNHYYFSIHDRKPIN